MGDQILEVNGQSFTTIPHDEAVYTLKTGHHLRMKVRDIGRLPQARILVDDPKWISSQGISESSATAYQSPVINTTVNAGISATICNRR